MKRGGNSIQDRSAKNFLFALPIHSLFRDFCCSGTAVKLEKKKNHHCLDFVLNCSFISYCFFLFLYLRNRRNDEIVFSSKMEGPLSKWTNVIEGWQYRWFVLDEHAGILAYYTVSCFY